MALLLPLEEDLPLNLGLLFRTLAPMRNLDRIRQAADGIVAMSREEASSWLSRAMHRKYPRRVPAALRTRLTIPRSCWTTCYDYVASANPPVLHRKESYVLPSDPLHAKFARLTAQEARHGLLDEPSGIGTRAGWARRLSERGFCLKGHRL